MKFVSWFTLAAAVLVAAPAFAEEPSPFKDQAAQESYAIGAQTARNLRKDMPDIDLEMLVRGLRDGYAGKLLVSDADLKALMEHVQQSLRKSAILDKREQANRNRVEAAKYLADNLAKPGVKSTASGLQYIVVTQGKGATPFLNSVVQVKFRGTLANGAPFDASAEGGASELVVAQLLPGFKEALQMMPVGSHWQLFVPPNLGYGEQGREGKVGPNQLLLVDLELVGIKQGTDLKQAQGKP